MADISLRYLFFFGIVTTLVLVTLYQLAKKRGKKDTQIRLYQKLPLLFYYTIVYLFVTLGLWAVLLSFGLDSLVYQIFYYAARYTLKLLLLAILFRAFQLLGGKMSWQFALLLIVPTILLYESYYLPTTSVYKKINNAMLSFNALFGMLVYFHLLRNHTVRLGRTWSGILLGVYLPCLVDWSNYTFYIFVSEPNFVLFSYINQTTNVIAWMLVLRAVKVYEEPGVVGLDRPDQIGVAFKRAATAARRLA